MINGGGITISSCAIVAVLCNNNLRLEPMGTVVVVVQQYMLYDWNEHFSVVIVTKRTRAFWALLYTDLEKEPEWELISPKR